MDFKLIKYFEDILTTERLIIRALNLSDASFILELVNTEKWKINIGDKNVKTIEQASFYVNQILNNETCFYWVVTLKNSLLPIGIITLVHRNNLECPDFGFAFLPKYHQQGFAIESTQCVLNTIISQNHFKNILAITLPENDPSIQLLSKLKFSFIQEISVNSETLWVFELNN